MSRDEPSQEPGQGWAEGYLFYLAIAAALGLVVLLILSLWGPTGPGKGDGGTAPGNPLETARSSLSSDTHLNRCGVALQQLNAYLSQEPSRRPAPPAPEQRDRLAQQFGLDPGEVAEITGPTFTSLDARYLEGCLLFQAAATFLDVTGPRSSSGKALTPSPLRRVTTAFDWSVRQVRLDKPDTFVAPPQFVVRRGSGSELERALVFLELLRQIARPDEQMTGCLIYLPERGSLTPRLWACGVRLRLPELSLFGVSVAVVEGAFRVRTGTAGEVHLFDPRLGLALPGPGGRGVATLEQARQDPAVLAQLDASESQRYDVTAEQANAAELHLYIPLSGLAPRQEKCSELLGAAVRVNLVAPALADLERLREVKGPGGKAVRVEVWKDRALDGRERSGAGLLRRFLPPDEGGVDNELRKERFRFALVPMKDMPPRLLDPNRFPGKNAEAVRRLKGFFAVPFARRLDDNQPRDLLLRGELHEAIPLLTKEEREIDDQAARFGLQKEQLPAAIDEWAREAEVAYTTWLRLRAEKQGDTPEVQRAFDQVEAYWRTPAATPLIIFLQGELARVRAAEVAYELALCTQEQAERLQARLDLLIRHQKAIKFEDWEAARLGWNDARINWASYRAESLAQVKRLAGRAHAKLAEALTALVALRPDDAEAPKWRQEAAKNRAAALLAWRSGEGSPVEKLAALYLARRLAG